MIGFGIIWKLESASTMKKTAGSNHFLMDSKFSVGPPGVEVKVKVKARAREVRLAWCGQLPQSRLVRRIVSNSSPDTSMLQPKDIVNALLSKLFLAKRICVVSLP